MLTTCTHTSYIYLAGQESSRLAKKINFSLTKEEIMKVEGSIAPILILTNNNNYYYVHRQRSLVQTTSSSVHIQ